MMVSVRMNTYMPVCPLVVIIDLSSLLGLGSSQMDTSLDQSFENIITEFYEVWKKCKRQLMHGLRYIRGDQ
jgi:hypothetical protein